MFGLMAFLCATAHAQKYPEFKDPADWIPLEKNFNYVSTAITPRAEQIPEAYSTPIKFASLKENDIFSVKVSIDFLKYGFSENGQAQVLLEGTVDLSCCQNKIARLELIDSDGGHPLDYGNTDEEGRFIFTSKNGDLMEFDNYKLKFNFDIIKVIDADLNEKQVELVWLTQPDRKSLKRIRKKALRDYKRQKRNIDDMRKNS